MMPEFEQWVAFNTAVAGAGAALGGLLIVALSVNIKLIAESPGLAARAGASIAGLILGVALCCLALIPGQTLLGYGPQVLIGAIVCGVLAVLAARALRRDSSRDGYHQFDAVNILTFSLPIALFLIGGGLALAGLPAALVVVAVGSIVAIISTVLFSWVALVEVLR